jgi:cysteine-S-conjugate beta-lyase
MRRNLAASKALSTNREEHAGDVASWRATENALSLSTRVVHPKSAGAFDPYDATGPPLYQTATFGQPGATEGAEYDYTRSGNPTRQLFEDACASLEGADRGLAFASGMAALSAVLRLASVGSHVVAGDDLYGGTSRLLSTVPPAAGIEVTNVDTTNVETFKKALRPGETTLVFLESPTNPRMRVCDLRACITAAKEAGALVCVDNSMLPILFCRPLDLGADICMTSVTKFIGGHSDVTGGLLTVKGAELAQRLKNTQNSEGAILGPMDSWLAVRGLRTMDVRMRRQVYNCERLARYVAAHPLCTHINYAGLPSSPDYKLQMSQAENAGSLFSFTTGNLAASKAIVEHTKLYKTTVSFGSVTSQISLPCFMSHASIPAAVRAERGLVDDLVRISAGVEDIGDLLADLDQAMMRAMEAAGMEPTSYLDATTKGLSEREATLEAKVRTLEQRLREIEGN